jgi:hypothetical protein
MKFTEIAARLNSVGTPFLSVGWVPSKTDADLARRVIRFLEDRRVLFNPCAVEEPKHCAESVLQIRTKTTAVLEEAREGSELYMHLGAIRAACRKFLDSGHVDTAADNFRFGDRHSLNSAFFFMALGELRATIGQHVALMAVKWEIDVEKDLATVLPAS